MAEHVPQIDQGELDHIEYRRVEAAPMLGQLTIYGSDQLEFVIPAEQE